jgi:hypothetical protein
MNTATATATREHFLSRFNSAAEAIEFENHVQQIGREFLPPAAIAVRQGEEPTSDYWRFLIEQHEQMQGA